VACNASVLGAVVEVHCTFKLRERKLRIVASRAGEDARCGPGEDLVDISSHGSVGECVLLNDRELSACC